MSPDETAEQGRIWITGAAGLIGHNLVRLAELYAPPGRIIPLTRADLDLTDFAAVERKFRADGPRVVIHAAAMSRTPQCEANPDLARRINVAATGHLAQLAEAAYFIFFSTDLVFDGKKGNYVESDSVHPLSLYGETKVAAEAAVGRNKRHAIVRTSLNSGASPGGRSAYNELLRCAWAEGKTAQLFRDEFRSPIAAAVTARAVWEMAARQLGGTWHLAGSERLSRVQLGQLVAAWHPELTARLESGSVREYQGEPRPEDVSLNCAKLQQHLSFRLPGLTEWLRDHPEDAF